MKRELKLEQLLCGAMDRVRVRPHIFLVEDLQVVKSRDDVAGGPLLFPFSLRRSSFSMTHSHIHPVDHNTIAA